MSPFKILPTFAWLGSLWLLGAAVAFGVPAPPSPDQAFPQEPFFDDAGKASDINCPDVWDPVCGVDGQTYSNACYAGSVGIACHDVCPCEPPPPSEPPYIEVGPEIVAVLDGEGDTFQFTATLVEPEEPRQEEKAPCGSKFCQEEPSYRFKWTSSNPEQVSIDENGLAKALSDDAFALILVTLESPDAEFPYVPGEASVMVAKLGKEVIQLDDELVQAVDIETVGDALGDLEAPITLTLSNTGQTREIKAGQHLLFGQSYAVKAVEVIPPINLFHPVIVKADLLALTEIYEELNLTVNGQQLQNLQLAKGSAMGYFKSEGDWNTECGLELIWQQELGTEVHIEIQNHELQQLVLYSELFVAASLLEEALQLQLECAAELPPIPAAHIPLSGLSFGLDIIALLKAKVVFQIAPEGTVVTPDFSISNTIGGGLTYDPVAGTQVPTDIGTPEKSFNLNTVNLDEPHTPLDLSIEALVGFEVGVRGTLYLGPWRIKGLGLLSADMVVSDVELGRRFGMPYEAFLTPASNDYRGPAFSDVFTLDVFPLKTIGFAQDGWFEKLGLGYVEGPKFELINAEAPFPVPSNPSLTHSTVYVGGIEEQGYPPCTTIRSVLSNWNNPVFANPIDSCRIAIWPTDGSWVFGYTFDGLDEVYCPTADMEGEWYLRAECAYNEYSFIPSLLKWVFPTVSDLTTLTIETVQDLYFDPEETEVFVPVGGSEDVELSIHNNTGTAQTFSLATDLPSFLTVDTQSQTVPADGSTTTTVTVDCSDVADVIGEVQFVTAAAHRNASIEVHCTLFDVVPQVVSAGAEVDESWTGSFQIVNETAEELWWIASGDVIFLPTNSGTIPAGGSASVAGTRICGAKGDFTYHGEIYGSLPDGTHHRRNVTFDVTCTDDGGDSWGDPHLKTFDGVPYDFQAPGEFVLSRATDGSFEVQTRQVRLGVPYTRVAVNEAAAMSVEGDRVGFYLHPPAGGGKVMVNGQALDLSSDLEVGETYVLPNLGEIERVQNKMYVVRWPSSNARVDVREAGSFRRALNLFVKPPPTGTLVGLLGDQDGDDSNDFVLRDGQLIAGSPPSHGQLHDCSGGVRCFAYDATGGWWIQTEQESLFDYSPGTGPLSFAPAPGDPPPAEISLDEFDQDLVDWAEAQCLSAGLVAGTPELLACMLDILASGDIELGTSGVHHSDPPPTGPFNIIASSEYAPGWRWNVVDNQYGTCNQGEWATAGQPTGWIEIHFPAVTTVSEVTLFDRACEEGVEAGHLEFSDGSPDVSFGTLPDDGQTGLDISFSPRHVTWVRVVLDQTEGQNPNPGLGEILINGANPSP